MRENSSADSHRLCEPEVTQCDALSLKVKALARTASGKKCAVVGYMRDDFYLLGAKQFLRRDHNTGNWRRNTRKRSHTNQRQNH
jgi:hypothetical protein